MLGRVLDLGCVGVSLDGPPEAHDVMRVYPDGRGSYADAIRGLDRLRTRAAAQNCVGYNRVCATFTSAYPDVASIYDHLFGLGFEAVSLKPVRCKPNKPYSLRRSLDEMCESFGLFAEKLLSLPEPEAADRLRRIMPASGSGDNFGRFLKRVVEQHLLGWRCPGGTQNLVVHTDGHVYICPSLCGVPEARLGSVWEGIDDARVADLAEQLQVSHRVPCKDCWARFLCGGGCMHQSYLTFGDLFRPDPAECALNKHLIELAIWFYAELKEKRPTVLEQLHKPPADAA